MKTDYFQIHTKLNCDVEEIMNVIASTHNYLNALLRDLLKKYTITCQQYMVLKIIFKQHPNPISVGVINSKMTCKKSNTSRIIDKLEQKEYVYRVVCPFDNRQIDIFLTIRGIQILEEITLFVQNEMQKKNTLSKAELKSLNSL